MAAAGDKPIIVKFYAGTNTALSSLSPPLSLPIPPSLSLLLLSFFFFFFLCLSPHLSVVLSLLLPSTIFRSTRKHRPQLSSSSLLCLPLPLSSALALTAPGRNRVVPKVHRDAAKVSQARSGVRRAGSVCEDGH
eukprot:3940083-Rhodomonas_salina.2